MNQKTVKKLRQIIGYQADSPEQKRHFKRLKKQYNKLSEEAKPLFLEKLAKIYDNTDSNINLNL
tara:strand:- start:1737 stop:1928 length:192 start_codon:yes stop_codon:yes gene_type:complete